MKISRIKRYRGGALITIQAASLWTVLHSLFSGRVIGVHEGNLGHDPGISYSDPLQARIQVLGLEGAKFVEGTGSGDRLGPQSGPGRNPSGGGGGGRQLLQLSDYRA